MARCPHCRKHFRVLEDEDDGQHGCPYCGYSEEPRLTLADEEEPEDDRSGAEIDADWETLAEAVDRGNWPETEVDL